MDPVSQLTALGDQVLAIVQQGTQVRSLPHRQPDRRQGGLAHRDPGDGDRIDRVGLALTRLGAAFPGRHQRRYLDHADIRPAPVQREIGGDAASVMTRALDPDPHHLVGGQ